MPVAHSEYPDNREPTPARGVSNTADLATPEVINVTLPLRRVSRPRASARASNLRRVVDYDSAYAKCIANNFLFKYYTILSRDPSRIYTLYSDNAYFVRSMETQTSDPCLGRKAIRLYMAEYWKEGCRIYVSAFDAQPNAEGSIVVQVTGDLSERDRPWRKFTHCLLLASYPRGYRVENDVLRYIGHHIHTPEEDELGNVRFSWHPAGPRGYDPRSSFTYVPRSEGATGSRNRLTAIGRDLGISDDVCERRVRPDNADVSGNEPPVDPGNHTGSIRAEESRAEGPGRSTHTGVSAHPAQSDDTAPSTAPSTAPNTAPNTNPSSAPNADRPAAGDILEYAKFRVSTSDFEVVVGTMSGAGIIAFRNLAEDRTSSATPAESSAERPQDLHPHQVTEGELSRSGGTTRRTTDREGGEGLSSSADAHGRDHASEESVRSRASAPAATVPAAAPGGDTASPNMS